MVFYKLVQYGQDYGSDYFDKNPDQLSITLEFDFFSYHTGVWLYDEDFDEVRTEIERREKLIYGRVYNPDVTEADELSDVVNSNSDLDPDRELTSIEFEQLIEAQMIDFASRHDISVDDFKQMIGEHMNKAHRKKPKGFGKKTKKKQSKKQKAAHLKSVVAANQEMIDGCVAKSLEDRITL